MLATAVKAARSAGRLMAERYPDRQEVTVKGYRDIVTETDTAAESIILRMIGERFPDHHIVSEEKGGDEWGNGYAWIVDPLDGTTNYAHHLPVFCVSIGVLEEGVPLLGVVYDPLLDQIFVAERGEGASLNGAPIHASDVTEVRKAVISLDWAHSDAVRAQSLAVLNRLALECRTVRALGSAALALAYVSAGWLDAYYNLALKPWDSAAGCLLITEAGGRCTDMSGGTYSVNMPDCVASNGGIHEKLLHLIGR
ncbi:MAG: inositol monophosphatase [Anaerolineae bacterium]|nr:inositol monophosphatase [Anaerolineae bacterium]